MIPMPDINVDPVIRTPQTTIVLYYGIPWDNRYTHVRLYLDDQHRRTQMSGKIFLTITQAAPVRMGELNLSVPYNEMVASQCNYLSFQNKPFDERWHYAFITSIEPMGDNATRIHFELDVWQECVFEVQQDQPMFVERSHIKKADDVLGANTIPENFETGGYKIYGNQWVPPLSEENQYDIVFATTFDKNGNVVPGQRVGGVYAGLELKSFESVADANDFIETITNNNLLDGIVDCFMVPHFATQGMQSRFVSVGFALNESDYAPKNKKALTYPYNYIYATNNCGTSVEYRFEWFSDPNAIQFSYALPLTPNPALMVWPKTTYKNMPSNIVESITFNNYPRCALAIDSYKAWLAQSGSGRAVEALTNMFDLNLSSTGKGLLQAGVDMFLRNGLSVVTNPLSTITNTLAQQTQAYVQAPGSKNNIANALYHAMQLDHITLYHVQVREEFMKRIDDYWSMFGYPIGEIQVPDWNTRTWWNYIKTVDCSYKGSLELDMLSRFRQIFDNGVTIWHTDDYFGNYDLSN